MNGDRIPAMAMRWKVAGKLCPGRPRTTWQHTVRKDLKKLNMQEDVDTDRDRGGLMYLNLP